jgi:hypothetical protein
MQLTASTVRRTVETPALPSDAAPAWTRPAVAVAAVTAAAATVVGVLEARLPVGPGGSSFHHVYPFAVGAVGLGATLIAARTARQRGDHGWLRLLAAGGVGYTLNALVIAALMLAVTPGSVLPVTPLAWIEGWLWMPFDFIMIGLLLTLLPGTRLARPTRVVAGIVAVLTGLGMVLNAVAQPVMENTDHVANPLAIPALAPLGQFGDLGCLLAMLVAVLAAIVRHTGLMIRKDPAGRRVGRRGLPLTLASVVMFFVTGALTTDDAPLSANLITGASLVLGMGAVVVVGSRLVGSRLVRR